jgi:FkbM family methyltransferase
LNINDYIEQYSYNIIHVGAACARREVNLYKDKVAVLIEPRKDAYNNILKRIRGRQNMFALNYLVINMDNKVTKFYITSNRGLSSSIFELKEHKEIWKNVREVKVEEYTGYTLDYIINKHKHELPAAIYDTLVMDTQGSELLVLQGAKNTLKHIRFIKTEICDFDSYNGCCKLKELEEFLAKNNFKEITRELMISKDNKNYWDILYGRAYKL